MKFISLFIFLAACADEPSISTQDSKKPVDLPSNDKELPHKVPDVVVFHYPYNEDGTFIYSSDKEFHKKDCEGYRGHYGIQKETLPCESDDGIQFIKSDHLADKKYLSQLEFYTNYNRVDSIETITYNTRIEISSEFSWGENGAFPEISIHSFATNKTYILEDMSIYLWSYEFKTWKHKPTIEGCTGKGVFRNYLDATIKCIFPYGKEDVENLNAIIHNEEVFRIEVQTKEVEEDVVNTKIRNYIIPTPSFRVELHRAWKHRYSSDMFNLFKSLDDEMDVLKAEVDTFEAEI